MYWLLFHLFTYFYLYFHPIYVYFSFIIHSASVIHLLVTHRLIVEVEVIRQLRFHLRFLLGITVTHLHPQLMHPSPSISGGRRGKGCSYYYYYYYYYCCLCCFYLLFCWRSYIVMIAVFLIFIFIFYFTYYRRRRRRRRRKKRTKKKKKEEEKKENTHTHHFSLLLLLLSLSSLFPSSFSSSLISTPVLKFFPTQILPFPSLTQPHLTWSVGWRRWSRVTHASPWPTLMFPGEPVNTWPAVH